MFRAASAQFLPEVLAGTLGLSFAGLVALRYLGPIFGFRTSAVVLALTITAATAGLGWLMLRLLLRPMRALQAYAQAQESGRSAPSPLHFGTRETAATAARVIAMADALRDREATIRTFTDHVTHELKTPVAAIRAASELLQDGGALSPGDARLVVEIDGARAQIEAQLSALRCAAQAREVRHLGQSHLGEVLDALCLDFPNLKLQCNNENLVLPIAPEGLTIVLRHMLSNAAEHGAAQVMLEAGMSDTGPTLDISDDGGGISEGNETRIFEPFFTTRRELGGTGMGLTIVRTLLTAHKAGIIFCTGRPTRFRIFFTNDEAAGH